MDTTELQMNLKILKLTEELKGLKKELKKANDIARSAEERGYDHGYSVGLSDGRRLMIDEFKSLLRINENS